MNLPIALLLIGAALTASTAADEPCNIADILVIVDSSATIGSERFQEIQGKLGDFVAANHEGLDVAYSFMTFGTHVHESAQFNVGVDVEDVVYEFLELDNGQTVAAPAFASAASYFEASNGARPKAFKYIVFLSDGAYTDNDDALVEAGKLRDQGYSVIGVGVGQANMDGIRAIASDDLSYDASNLGDFQGQWEDFMGKIKRRAAEECESECSEEADIVIVLDCSASIDEDDFDKIKEKLAPVVTPTKMGDISVKWAYIQFSTTPKDVYTWADGWMNPEYAVDWFYYGGAQSYAEKALESAQEMLEGGRADAHKFILYIADGLNDDESEAKAKADALKQSGVTIFSIGAGRRVDTDRLGDISSPGLTYNGNDNRGLSDGNLDAAFEAFSKDVAEACGPGPEPEPTEPCPKAADIIILMDVSASIPEDDFDFIKSKLPDLVGPAAYGDVALSWAYIQFTTTAKVIFNFGDFFPTAQMAVDWFYYEGGQSYSQKGLNEAKKMFNKARSDTKQYVFYISDGVNQNGNEAKAKADILKRDGTTIFCIGAGSSVDMAGLGEICSPGVIFDVTNNGALSNSKLKNGMDKFIEDVTNQCAA